MKRLFYLFTLLLFCTVIFTSCKKDDDDDATPKTGSIKATVSPASAATNMRITLGSTTIEVTPNSPGNFHADNITPGDYSVTFTPAMGFQGPAARNVTVTAGNTADLGTVTFTQPGNLLLGNMSATVNGTAWNSAIHAATVNNGLTITGSAITATGNAEAIILTLPTATGTGTFTAPNATAVYTLASLTGGGTPLTWGSGGPFANCTVTITKFDQTSSKISGTFSFVAYAAPGTAATGTKTVTNGAFNNLNIQ